MRTRLVCSDRLRKYIEDDYRALTSALEVLLRRMGIDSPRLLVVRAAENADPDIGPTFAHTDRSITNGRAAVRIIVGADLIRADLRRIVAHEMCHIVVVLACGAPDNEYACLAHEYLAERLCWELQAHSPDDDNGDLREIAANVSDFFIAWAMPTHLSRTAAHIRGGAGSNGPLSDSMSNGILNGLINAIYAKGKSDAFGTPDVFGNNARIPPKIVETIGELCAPLYLATEKLHDPITPSGMCELLNTAESNVALSDAKFETAWTHVFEAMRSANPSEFVAASPVPDWISTMVIRRS